MLASFLIVKTENECVLLFTSLVIIFDHHKCQLLLLKVKLADLWPEEETNLLYSLKHQNSGWCQTEMILAAVFPKNRVHVNAVHFLPFCFVEIIRLGLSWCEASKFSVFFKNGFFHVFRLIRHEAKFGNSCGRVSGCIIVTKFSWK